MAYNSSQTIVNDTRWPTPYTSKISDDVHPTLCVFVIGSPCEGGGRRERERERARERERGTAHGSPAASGSLRENTFYSGSLRFHVSLV